MPVVFTCDLRHDGLDLATAAASALPGEVVYGSVADASGLLDHQVRGARRIDHSCRDAVEEVFPPGLMQDMLTANMRLLDALARSDEAWGETAGSLTPESHIQLAAAANATDAPIAIDLLHELFARQVALDPGKVAVVSGDRSMTYGELFHRADHLGRRLRELGTRPNVLVGVVWRRGGNRSAVMGVLHAGGAYCRSIPTCRPSAPRHADAHGKSASLAVSRRRDSRA